VNEHQTVFTQVSNDGGTRFVAVLARVAVFERLFVVRELKMLAPLHGLGAMLALAESSEVAQVAVAVRARHMGGKFVVRGNFQDVQQVPTSVQSELLGEPLGVVL
jgi:hypothetical protein